jgi:Tol biopolymer transport system component
MSNFTVPVGWILLTAILCSSTPGRSQTKSEGPQRGYAPAYYSGTQLEQPRIVVFSPAGREVTIPLPTPGRPRFTAFAPDGRAIYATVDTFLPQKSPGVMAPLGAPRLIRVDLAPVQTNIVSDLAGIAAVLGIVVSPRQDRILFTGSAGTSLTCDLFEIGTSGSGFRRLLPDFGCGISQLSPDGTKMLIQRSGELSVVSLSDGTAVSLGNGLWKGAWSPDGKWIAALHLDPQTGKPVPRHSTTMRIDANNLAERVVLGGTGDVETVWSPDSKYLLYSEWKPPCPDKGNDPSLVVMDVATGKREIVKGSRCKVNSYRYVGWVSLDVLGETQ